MGIHSSWNSDRIAACCIGKTAKVRIARPVRMFAQTRGHNVKVYTYRGSLKFEHVYDSKIISAIICDRRLVVELENHAVYSYDVAGWQPVIEECRAPAVEFSFSSDQNTDSAA